MEDLPGVLKQQKRKAWLLGVSSVVCFFLLCLTTFDDILNGAVFGFAWSLGILFTIWLNLRRGGDQGLTPRVIVISSALINLLAIGIWIWWRGASVAIIPDLIWITGFSTIFALYRIQLVKITPEIRRSKESPELTS